MKPKVVISNELVRAAYTLSLNEKRLVMYAVSQLEVGSNRLINFPAIDCARFYKMSESSARARLKQAMNSLWDRELVIASTGIGHRWIISRGKYDNGILTFRFHPELEPHLFDLKSCFTQYFLERAADFKLFYTWRIFEMLMQYRKTGFMTLTVETLKEKLELTDYYSRDFGRIRSKVINPAIKEIRTKAGVDVTWKSIPGKGRKIERLEFRFPVEQQKTIQFPKSKPLAKANLSRKQAADEIDGMSKSQIKAEYDGLKQLAAVSGDPINLSPDQAARFKAVGLM